MLRKIRIILACVFFIGITLLFVGTGHQWWGWMAKLQFLPSCIALNVAVIAGITLLTLIFGRIYCSVICPLGVFQDSVNWLSAKRKGKKRRFTFHKEHKVARYAVLGALVASIIAGCQIFTAVIAPYSAYGRMVRSIAGLAAGDSMAWPLLAVAGVTLVMIFLCAWLWGREYCNTVCPVGTVLSLFSRFALFRPVIDSGKCVGCHGCEKKCKASCIDSATQTIDYSRCLDCFDCISDCKAGAIKYRFAYGAHRSAGVGTKGHAAPGTEEGGPQAKHSGGAGEAGSPGADTGTADKGRRNFIATTTILGSAALSAATGIDAFAQDDPDDEEVKHLDGGLAEILPKKDPERTERLVPPGAGSIKDFYSRCTGCQLCVSACPNGVLRPSTDIRHILQPKMGFDRGYCRPECTSCSEVCPTGAILPITREQKTTIHIGTAKVNLELCITVEDDVECGNCARHCPTGAIRMVKADGYKHQIPTIAEDICIGCGACENLCPSRPISAITVNGLSEHRNG